MESTRLQFRFWWQIEGDQRWESMQVFQGDETRLVYFPKHINSTVVVSIAHQACCEECALCLVQIGKISGLIHGKKTYPNYLHAENYLCLLISHYCEQFSN